jgi:hypothetical protein
MHPATESRERACTPKWPRACASTAAFIALWLVACAQSSDPSPYRGASHVPDSRRGWEALQTKPDPDAPQDEAKGGRTARGTTVNRRTPDCFPAETRNLFSKVDQVASGPGTALAPFDYSDGHVVSAAGRNAIRGQNTWLLWGEGNEAFWGWLQEKGYGFVDFLVLLDSRERGKRFHTGGMINQPGMKSSRSRILGLYLDEADGDRITLQQPASDLDATGKLAQRVATAPDVPACSGCHSDPKRGSQLFEPGDPKLYADVIQRLPKDGVDPAIYGYPSGVVGLRLLPNPDFFGTGAAAQQAREYWAKRVQSSTSDAYYTDRTVQQDPALVRPFRVSMSCGFCHLGPHPLNPPADPENPQWENLSSTIGNQYWSPQPLFANLTSPDSILYQFLASQQPGTVDTSLVSTDHINNANTITAVFDVDARLVRSTANPPEAQSSANLLSPVAQLPPPLVVETDQRVTPRHTPRVLLDGADSIGAFGALSRVYLNIGTFPEEWGRCHNPVIGFKPQRPFALATLQSNSVYWQTSEKYRIPYLASFFTYVSNKTNQSIVAPMKLANAPAGQQVLAGERPLVEQGGRVFLNNCAICHSSKQPAGFELGFSREWRTAPTPLATAPAHFTLPATYADWDEFRGSATYKEYVRRLSAEIVGTSSLDDFVKGNFLSTDVRVPITLVGTNSGRAVGTNGMSGQVWDNFSSDTYKQLPAVGAVRFYNPFSSKPLDQWGNNDEYYPPGGGPGYYRPASLISLWATGPYLHNNTLGVYDADPSVGGRLRAFDDGIDKLLWKSKRPQGTQRVYGDLRGTHPELTRGDPGLVYRIPVAASIGFPAVFNRALLEGVLGPTRTSLVTRDLWIALTVLAVVLAWIARPRHAAFFLLLIAVGAAVALVVTRFDRIWPWLWLLCLVPLGLALYLWLASPSRNWARAIFLASALAFAATAVVLHRFVDGELGPISVGPIPQGAPINLIMNINPEAPMPNLIRAVSGMTRGIFLSRREQDPARALQVFEREAGQALLEASKCPDFVLDRGHWFAEGLSDDEKQALKAFLRTL